MSVMATLTFEAPDRSTFSATSCGVSTDFRMRGKYLSKRQTAQGTAR
jgi:hypothetical protein